MKSLALIAVVLALTSIAYSEDKPECPFKKIKPVKVGKYTLRITGRLEAEDAEDNRCIATAVLKSGGSKTIAKEWAMSFTATGNDLNGDGTPDAVIEGYSGGAHCCWTYWFVSLGTLPKVFAKLHNDRGLEVDLSKPGRTLLYTLDGTFDYFDGFSHAYTPFPTVILELRGERFYDVSSQFVDTYDREIADTRRELEKQPLQNFRAHANFKNDHAEFEETAKNVLSIVLAYLYSGREEQAWKELSQMWPESDQKRMKKLILETRATGFLAQIDYSKRNSSHQTK